MSGAVVELDAAWTATPAWLSTICSDGMRPPAFVDLAGRRTRRRLAAMSRVEVASRPMQPIIGITTYGRVERPTPSDHYADHYSVPVQYVQAVRRAGGVAVLIPPGDLSGDGWLERLDGLVVSGGVDVEPARYGGDGPGVVQEPDGERDETELALALTVVDVDLPALFVCRGMQVLNVAFGGTLHAHIPDLGIGDIHRNGDGLWTTHEVNAVRGSRVAEAMGADAVSPVSGHHQAVDRVADRLDVTATAPDGIVEALEVADRRWIVGVQWHPEVTAATHVPQQGIFDRLVAEAR